jgi:predicted nucleic acid-binding protein
VDTGAWIALISSDDEHHLAAESAFNAAVAQRVALITTNLVVAEVHRFLLFRAGPAAARKALERIDASRRLKTIFVGRDHHRAAKAWLARFADQEFTYTDAVSFAVMDSERCPVAIAFDEDFSIAGFSLWRHLDIKPTRA